MPLPRFVEIDGRRVLWHDLVAAAPGLGHAVGRAADPLPAARRLPPSGERTAAERYQAPSLFTALECAD